MVIFSQFNNVPLCYPFQVSPSFVFNIKNVASQMLILKKKMHSLTKIFLTKQAPLSEVS